MVRRRRRPRRVEDVHACRNRRNCSDPGIRVELERTVQLERSANERAEAANPPLPPPPAPTHFPAKPRRRCPNMLFSCACVLLALLPLVSSFLENSIIGTPKVLCEDNDLAIDIVTAKPFHGNIFVKGRAKDKSCRQSYANNGSNSYSLPLGKCGMQRLRSANPRGVNFVVTVLVSFHPAGFITKNDRAFHVKCFYMEPDSIVSQSIDVSSLPTTELQDSMAMPKCEYSVRRDSPNGPTLTFANVGETVYHVWECNPPDMGMLVKKCFVTDGDGEDHAVVDYDGCSTDSFLLSELIYDGNLMKAHATSQVFKYADSNQLYFTCQIRLCQRQMGMCQDVTPPVCGFNRQSNRTRRETNRWRDPEVDVATHEMLVLDAEERRLMTSSPLCVPKITLPLIPLVLLTVAAVSVSVTLVVVSRKKDKVLYAA